MKARPDIFVFAAYAARLSGGGFGARFAPAHKIAPRNVFDMRSGSSYDFSGCISQMHGSQKADRFYGPLFGVWF